MFGYLKCLLYGARLVPCMQQFAKVSDGRLTVMMLD